MMKSIISISILCLSLQAFSYPIVSDSESIRQGDILTLYPDHKDPNKVYFFPNSSMLARDNSNLPMFGFTAWGLNEIPFNPANAGAWMTFTSRLTSDPMQKAAIDRYLEDNPTKRIAVVPVKESTLGIQSNSNTKPFAGLIDEMSISSMSGHAEDEIGFMGTLTGVGARVFKEAIKKPDTFKMIYCYSFDGAGPDMDAKITVKWNRVYDHYRTSFSVGNWWRKVRITKEVEKLRQKGDVHWEINGGSADDQEYVTTIAEMIVKRLFEPVLQYKPAGETEAPKGWSFLSFRHTSTHRSEFKEETWTMARRELVERERCLPVNVRDVQQYYDQLVSDV